MSRVRLNGELSRVIRESRGIRQGEETSTDGFKAKDNKFLNRIRCHQASLKIGCTPLGIPTVAHNNFMLSRSHTAAQNQLLLAQHNASKDRYVFSATKSKVVYIPDKATKADIHKEDLQFNDITIEYSTKETHPGLSRTPDSACTQAVKDRIQTGRRIAYQLMGAGLSGMNGISPHISKTLVNVYVNPALMYGLESLRLEEKDVTPRQLPQRTPQNAPNTARVYCKAQHLSPTWMPTSPGTLQMLNIFTTILHRSGSAEFEIITRQLRPELKKLDCADKIAPAQIQPPTGSNLSLQHTKQAALEEDCKAGSQ